MEISEEHVQPLVVDGRGARAKSVSFVEFSGVGVPRLERKVGVAREDVAGGNLHAAQAHVRELEAGIHVYAPRAPRK